MIPEKDGPHRTTLKGKWANKSTREHAILKKSDNFLFPPGTGFFLSHIYTHTKTHTWTTKIRELLKSVTRIITLFIVSLGSTDDYDFDAQLVGNGPFDHNL